MSESESGATTHKFAIVLSKNIDPGVALNACGHMVACLVARAKEDQSAMKFVDYKDADGNVHPVSALSLVVLQAKNSNQIRTARWAAKDKGLAFVDFLATMTQGTYVEQMQRTEALREEELDYWGLALFGPRSEVDPVTKKFSLWRLA